MQKLPFVPAASQKDHCSSTGCAEGGKTGGQGIFSAGRGRSSAPCSAGARAARDTGDRRGDPGIAP